MGENVLFYLNVEGFSDSRLFDDWYGKMDEERRTKIDRYKNDKDKFLSLGAGVLLELGLKSRGVKNYCLEYGDRQKPYINSERSLFFNLSHSGNMVVLALSDKEVGVDVERNKKFNDSLVKYVFDEAEIELCDRLVSQGGEERDGIYPGFWTAKESVMKYFGIGIGMNPKNIHLEPKRSEHPDYSGFLGYMTVDAGEYDCSRLIISRYSIGEYQISVCSENSNFGPLVEMKL